jgi:hypothetical protein
MFSRKETTPQKLDQIRHHMRQGRIFAALGNELAFILNSFPKDKGTCKKTKNTSVHAVYLNLFRFEASLRSLAWDLDEMMFSCLPSDLSSECQVDGVEVRSKSLYFGKCIDPAVPPLTRSPDFSPKDVARIERLVERFIDVMKGVDESKQSKHCKELKEVQSVIRSI